jgi:hypothetical protein
MSQYSTTYIHPLYLYREVCTILISPNHSILLLSIHSRLSTIPYPIRPPEPPVKLLVSRSLPVTDTVYRDKRCYILYVRGKES